MEATFMKSCCGAAELSHGYFGCGVPDDTIIKQSLIGLAKQRMKVTFYIMTVTDRGDWGAPLRAYIEKYKLGEVTETPGWHLNQFHGPRSLKVYVWKVDKREWKKFCDENLSEDEKKKSYAKFFGVAPY